MMNVTNRDEFNERENQDILRMRIELAAYRFQEQWIPDGEVIENGLPK